jgi:hypothetical protein
MSPSTAPLEYLEYDEEDQQDDDLFGSDHDNAQPSSGPSTIRAYNTAKPVGAKRADTLISSTSSPISRKGKERAHLKDPQDRLDELRFMRLPKPIQERTGRGVIPLKEIAMSGMCLLNRSDICAHTWTVIRQNATRIWDIGDLEYRVIADFLHELPMEQLAEVESLSPVRLVIAP